MKQKTLLLLAGVFAFSHVLFSQIQGDTKQRVRTAHDLARQGEQAIAKLVPFVTDTDVSVRAEAVKSLVDIGGPKTVDLLVQVRTTPTLKSRSAPATAWSMWIFRATSRPASAARCSAWAMA